MTCNTQSYIKKHSNVDGDIIMRKLPKDGAARTVKRKKRVIQESLHTFLTACLFGSLTRSRNPVTAA